MSAFLAYIKTNIMLLSSLLILGRQHIISTRYYYFFNIVPTLSSIRKFNKLQLLGTKNFFCLKDYIKFWRNEQFREYLKHISFAKYKYKIILVFLRNKYHENDLHVTEFKKVSNNDEEMDCFGYNRDLSIMI